MKIFKLQIIVSDRGNNYRKWMVARPAAFLGKQLVVLEAAPCICSMLTHTSLQAKKETGIITAKERKSIS